METPWCNKEAINRAVDEVPNATARRCGDVWKRLQNAVPIQKLHWEEALPPARLFFNHDAEADGEEEDPDFD